LLNLDQAATRNWLQRQTLWTPETVNRLGRLVLDKIGADGKNRLLQHEVEQLSENLAAGYEEINLLYAVVESVQNSDDAGQLIERIAAWLIEVLPSEAIAIQLSSSPIGDDDVQTGDERAELLTFGDCPLGIGQFALLIEHLGPGTKDRPAVVNVRDEHPGQWPFPAVRELVMVPLTAGSTMFGWLFAMNHPEGKWFGTIQARLLKTVAVVLGMFSDKLRLYRQQSRILAAKSLVEERAAKLKDQVEQLSSTLRLSQQEVGRTYEQIVLIHAVLERLRQPADLREIGAFTIARLLETLPVDSVAVQFNGAAEEDSAPGEGNLAAILLRGGKCPLGSRRLGRLIADLGLDCETGALVMNSAPPQPGMKGSHTAPMLDCPEIRQLIVVPLVSAGGVFGWLAAMNHESGNELGTAEAILLSSVSALLGQAVACNVTSQAAGPFLTP
jgi:hypothetical protein